MTSKKNLFEWHSSATALLDDIFGTDVFESSNVIIIGLFEVVGWSSNSFQKAAQLWHSSTTTTVHHQEPQNNQPNDGGEENKEEEEERRGKVKFVGTHDAQIARREQCSTLTQGWNTVGHLSLSLPSTTHATRSTQSTPPTDKQDRCNAATQQCNERCQFMGHIDLRHGHHDQHE